MLNIIRENEVMIKNILYTLRKDGKIEFEDANGKRGVRSIKDIKILYCSSAKKKLKKLFDLQKERKKESIK